jgi:hypothetical protein
MKNTSISFNGLYLTGHPNVKLLIGHGGALSTVTI